MSDTKCQLHKKVFVKLTNNHHCCLKLIIITTVVPKLITPTQSQIQHHDYKYFRNAVLSMAYNDSNHKS